MKIDKNQRKKNLKLKSYERNDSAIYFMYVTSTIEIHMRVICNIEFINMHTQFA